MGIRQSAIAYAIAQTTAAGEAISVETVQAKLTEERFPGLQDLKAEELNEVLTKQGKPPVTAPAEAPDPVTADVPAPEPVAITDAGAADVHPDSNDAVGDVFPTHAAPAPNRVVTDEERTATIEAVHAADNALHLARQRLMEAGRRYAVANTKLAAAVSAFTSGPPITPLENVRQFLKSQTEQRRQRSLADPRAVISQAQHDNRRRRDNSYMDRAGKYQGDADDMVRSKFRGFGGMGGSHRGGFPKSMLGQKIDPEALRAHRAAQSPYRKPQGK